jgi:hypothetical protein
MVGVWLCAEVDGEVGVADFSAVFGQRRFVVGR